MLSPKFISIRLKERDIFPLIFKSDKKTWDTETTVLPIKEDIDELKDDYGEVYRQNPQFAQKVNWWINPLNKYLKQTIRRYYNPCYYPSNGFLKLFEILSHFSRFSKSLPSDNKINVFANAELPGGMIYACHHFYEQMGVEMDFVFSSLIDPDQKNKLGDDYGLIKEFEDRFIPLISADEDKRTGDVADPGEIEHIEKITLQRYPEGVDLYFSDGGINVDDDYNNQDRANAHVNLGQVICGLLTTKRGGMLITKQYNISGSWTWSLNYLVSSLFTETYIVKPKTSRHSNTETYLVGIGYLKPNGNVRKFLYDFITYCHETKDYVRNILPIENLKPPEKEQEVLYRDFCKFMKQLTNQTRESLTQDSTKSLINQMNKFAPRESKEWIKATKIQKIESCLMPE